MVKNLLVAFAVAIVSWPLSLGVAAQDFEQSQMSDSRRRAAVRVLFEEGLALGDDGNWDEAAGRFRRAYALLPSSPIAFNLGSALSRTGHLVEAAELLRDVTRDEETNARTRRAATEILDNIEPRIGRLTIVIEGDPTGATVALDSVEVDRHTLGIAIPTDPGTHQVTATRGDLEVASETVEVPEGQGAEVRLYVPAAVADPATAAETIEHEPERPAHLAVDDSGGSIIESPWFWVTIAAIVIVGAAIAIALVVTSGDEQPVEGDFDPGLVSWP